MLRTINASEMELPCVVATDQLHVHVSHTLGVLKYFVTRASPDPNSCV
jgi:hypothetical protein